MIIFIAALPLIDDYDICITFILVMLPLILFIAVTLFLHKGDLKKIVTHFTFGS